MKAQSSTRLLDWLDERVRVNLDLINALESLTDARLRQTPASGGWNALQAVEHVNSWNRGYLERVSAALRDHRTTSAAYFSSTWIGNYFATMLKPGPESKKIATLKSFNPQGQQLDRRVLATFRRQTAELQRLLGEARRADLNRIRIKTVLTSLIKMRLGDVLRMMVYHDWRHLEQACRAAGVPVREMAEV